MRMSRSIVINLNTVILQLLLGAGSAGDDMEKHNADMRLYLSLDLTSCRPVNEPTVVHSTVELHIVQKK